MKIKYLVILLGSIFWPISLYLNNTLPDFFRSIFPAIFSKLAIFPLTFFVVYILLTRKTSRLVIAFLLISLLLLTLNFKSFWGQTIFKFDYEAYQSVVRQTQLYPNIFVARLMHNKARVFVDKFNNNFFAITDPNNYFFRFHPRQITVNNQNLKKFPSLSIFIFALGILKLTKDKNRNLVVSFLVSATFSLSILTVFDRNDFLLWFPLVYLFTLGVKVIEAEYRKFSPLFFLLFIIFSSAELIQIFNQ